MQNLTEKEIDFYANLLATSFIDYPRNKEIAKGINDPLAFFKNLHKFQIMEFMKDDMIHLLDTRGIFIGYRSKEISLFRLFYRFSKMSRSLKKATDKQTMKIVLSNEQRIKKVDKFNWYKKYTGVKNYFYIMDLAIAKEAQGSGAFRQLITPVLQDCDQKNIPIMLETHSPENVKIYEHFGFVIVHVFEDPNLTYKQWCLVKYPKKSK